MSVYKPVWSILSKVVDFVWPIARAFYIIYFALWLFGYYLLHVA